MYNLAENIANLRIKKKYTQKELADRLGVSKGTITSYESGVRTPPIEKLEEMAQEFGVDISLFFKPNVIDLDITSSSNTYSRIPIISHASAGKGIFGEEEILDFLELPSKISTKCDFATYVVGNSMEPKISDGDIICIKRGLILENGDIGLFFLNDNIYVKKFKINPFTKQISLESLNKNYASLMVTIEDEFHELGKVVSKFDYNF